MGSLKIPKALALSSKTGVSTFNQKFNFQICLIGNLTGSMHDAEALSRLQYGSPFLEQKKGQLYADIWARPRNQALLAFDLAREF